MLTIRYANMGDMENSNQYLNKLIAVAPEHAVVQKLGIEFEFEHHFYTGVLQQSFANFVA